MATNIWTDHKKPLNDWTRYTFSEENLPGRYPILCVLLSFALLQDSGPQLTPSHPMKESEPLQVPTFTESKSILSNDKYLFVGIWIAFDGTGVLPMKFIDFPGHEYDAAVVAKGQKMEKSGGYRC